MPQPLRATSAVLLAALALAGCGAHDTHRSATGPAGGAPAAATATPAAKPAAGAAVSTVALLTASAQKVTTAGSAKIDGTVTTSLKGATPGAMSIRISGAEQWKPTLQAKLTMSGLKVGGKSAGVTKILLTPKAIYMSLPQLTAMTHKPWTELSFATLGKAAGGVNLSQLFDQAQQTAPAQYLAILTKSGDVHLVGTTTIDGVATQHYAGNVDLAKALAAASPALQSSYAALAKQGVTTEHVDVWLDSAGEPRRIQTTVSTSQMTVSTKLHVSGYGTKVVVVAPPAAQTFDLGKTLGAASK